jgi:hypothetical protein
MEQLTTLRNAYVPHLIFQTTYFPTEFVFVSPEKNENPFIKPQANVVTSHKYR